MSHTPWYFQEHPYIDVIDTFMAKLLDGQKTFKDVSVDYLMQRALYLRIDNSRLTAELEQARAEITIIGASWQEEHTEKIRLEELLKMAEARIHNLRAELFEVLEDQE